MIEPLGFVIICLAAFRLTRFLVRDSLFGFGPESGSRMSVRVDAFAYDNEGSDRSWLRGKIGDLLTCVWCLGFWCSLGITCAYLRVTPWELGLEGWAIAWAAAGGQGYISTRMNV